MESIKIIIGLVILVVIVGVILFFFGNIHTIPFLHTSQTVTIDNHTFLVTTATTDQQKEIGLSGRASLPQNEGMYFTFTTPDYYTFWMKGMRFPLDIIFIDSNTIVTIFKNVPVGKGNFLPTYKPQQVANAVLEINAGLSDKYGFKVGDMIQTHL